MIYHDGPGDMFASQCKTLVCPINVAGAMGKGLAKVFRDRYPGLWEFYQHHYPRTDTPAPEKVFDLKVFTAQDGRQILLLPTKMHWRDPSRIDWIDLNVRALANQWFDLGIDSIAIPALGCGEGGLDYGEVYPYLVEQFATNLLPVELYHPA